MGPATADVGRLAGRRRGSVSPAATIRPIAGHRSVFPRAVDCRLGLQASEPSRSPYSCPSTSSAFASKIASAAAEFSSKLPTGAYIAAGFVLFVLTFIVNALARAAAGGRVSGG